MAAENQSHWQIKLVDENGVSISDAGGSCYVSTVDVPAKATLTTSAGAALANPVTLSQGEIDFHAADSVLSVDLYGIAPNGQFFILKGVKPSGPNEIVIDTQQKNQVAKIPFEIDDTAAATETDTGFDMPAGAFMLGRLSGCGLDIVDLDATETIDVGTLSTESGGDPNGLIAASSVAAAGAVIGTNGALFSTNAPHIMVASTQSISYTLTAGTDAASGFILLPYMLK